MNSQSLLQAAKRLSISEWIALVERIWDSIPDESVPIPLTDAQKQELERRLAAPKSSPEAGKSWEDVKSSILSNKE